jgi:hypothetical protein
MKAAEILGVDAVRFVEPVFIAQSDSMFNTRLLEMDGDEGRLLIDEKQDPLAIAFHGTGGWVAGSFLYRNPTSTLIERFENVNGEIFEEERAVWRAALREYFSTSLMAEIPPAINDLNPARRGILTTLIGGIWGKGSHETCIDCCCGSGVGSLVLRDLDYTPLSYDNDAELLSRGLLEKRLLPHETLCIDARAALGYVEPAEKAIGIMMGEINSFTEEMWMQIVAQLFSLSKETLITVGTEKEADLIKRWGKEMDRVVDVKENPADPIYDLFVCLAKEH